MESIWLPVVKSALSKPQARLLGAEVPCNYIHGRMSGRTSEPFRKADFTPSRLLKHKYL